VMSIIVVHIRRRNTYKVHASERKKKEKTRNKEKAVIATTAVVVFFNIPMLRHTYIRISSNACTSHTFCLLFFLSLYSYMRVISVWWYLSSTGDDEKRARRRCL
jgi:protein-S-isoprenylcysteine O-methyltransferase Ste14